MDDKQDPTNKALSATIIPVKVGTYGHFLSELRLFAPILGVASKHLEAGTKPNLTIPDMIFRKLVTDAGPESDEDFTERKERRKEEIAKARRLETSATALTGFIARCPDAELRGRMLVDRDRMQTAISSSDFQALLELIREHAQLKANSRMVSTLHLLMRPQDGPAFSGDWVKFHTAFMANWNTWKDCMDMDKFQTVLYMSVLSPEMFSHLFNDWGRLDSTLTFDETVKQVKTWFGNIRASEPDLPPKSKSQRPDVVQARFVSSSPDSKSKKSEPRSKKPKQSHYPPAKPGDVCQHPKCRDFGSTHISPNHHFPGVKCTNCGREGHHFNACKKYKSVDNSPKVTVKATKVTESSHDPDDHFDIRNYIKARKVIVHNAGATGQTGEGPHAELRRNIHPAGLPILTPDGPISDPGLSSPGFVPAPLSPDEFMANTEVYSIHDTEPQVSTVFVNLARTQTNNPPEEVMDRPVVFDTACHGAHVTNDPSNLMLGSYYDTTSCLIEGFDGHQRVAQGVGNLPAVGKAIVHSDVTSTLISTYTMHQALQTFAVEDSANSSYEVFKRNGDGTVSLLYSAPYQEGVGYAITIRDLVQSSNATHNAALRDRARDVGRLMQSVTKAGKSVDTTSAENLEYGSSSRPRYALGTADSDDEVVDYYQGAPTQVSALNLREDLTSPVDGSTHNIRDKRRLDGETPIRSLHPRNDPSTLLSPEPPPYSPTDPYEHDDYVRHQTNIRHVADDEPESEQSNADDEANIRRITEEEPVFDRPNWTEDSDDEDPFKSPNYRRHSYFSSSHSSSTQTSTVHRSTSSRSDKGKTYKSHCKKAKMTQSISGRTVVKVCMTRMGRISETSTEEHITPNQRIRSQKVWNLHPSIGNHMPDTTFGVMLDAGMWPKHPYNSKDLRIARKLYGPCTACIQGKSKAKPKFDTTRAPPTKVGERVCMDLKQFSATTIGGNNWSLISTDSLSGWGNNALSASKNSNSLKLSVGHTVSTYNRYGHKVTELTSDPEQCILSIEQHLNGKGIKLDPTIPGRHMTEAERYIQRVYRLMETMLCDLTYELPKFLMGELESCAIECLNDTPNKKSFPRTPNQIVCLLNPHDKPYRFGTCGLFHSYKDKAEHAEYGIIVGWSRARKHQFRVYFPQIHKVLSRSSPEQIFNDVPPEWGWPQRNTPKLKILSAQRDIREGLPANANVDIQTHIQSEQIDPQSANPAPLISMETVIPESTPTMELDNSFSSDTETTPDDSSDTIPEVEIRQIREELNLTRNASGTDTSETEPIAIDTLQSSGNILESEPESKDIQSQQPPPVESRTSMKAAAKEARKAAQLKRLSKQLQQDLVKLEIEGPRSRRHDYAALVNKGYDRFDAQLSRISVIVNRISLKTALKSESNEMARESINKEIRSLVSEHKALICVDFDDIPIELRNKCILIHCFLKDKISPEGEFLKIKARIVAGGNDQDESTFGATTAPTINSVTLMLILHIMAAEDRECATFDVPSAFVRVPADENEPPIYGFMDPTLSKLVCELYPEYKTKLHRGCLYFRIAKYLYGLKQASRKFYEFMRQFFVNDGYEVCKFDPCLFIKRVGSETIVAAMHVDDILATAPNSKRLDELRLRLVEEFQVEQHLQSPYSFLGMTITRNREERTAKITMKSSIEKLIEKYAPTLPPKHTPSTQNLFNTTFPEEEALNASEQATFASLNMAIMYIARFCRIDTLLAPTILASRLKKASKSDLKELVRILQYYKATPDVGPTLGGKDLGPIKLTGISDASHSIIDGRGIGAIALTLGSAPIATRCWILKVGTLSSTESELLATTEITTYIIWARSVLDFLGYPQLDPTDVLQDNEASITMNNQGTGSFKRAKHIMARNAFITDYIREGIIKLVKIDTTDMMVDMLTKVHSRVPLQRNLVAAHLMSGSQSDLTSRERVCQK